jgi:His-Xaa-Ser system radical SAM maturase HxsC
MLKLGGKVIEITNLQQRGGLLAAVSTNSQLPMVLRKERAFLVKDAIIPEGFSHYIFLEGNSSRSKELVADTSFSVLPDDYSYLGDKDIVRLSSDKEMIRVLFRASSPHNSLLLTEQCNHYCLMCSQPPKAIDDSWIFEEVERVIKLIPRETREIGFTGGEPTLFGDRLLNLIRLAKNYLPNTAIHMLSNGRRFSDYAYSVRYADIQHHDLMVGIPIYSDDPARHDYVVQAKGAFDETIRGVLNLKRLEQKVEVRVVLHKQTIDRLPQLANFLARNLLFVDHVAFMGLEITGFTRANLETLWIDPYEYRDVLSESVNLLKAYGMNVSVYNHQLCIINDEIRDVCRKSISDWKNEYYPECDLCAFRERCGGFFASAKYRRSAHIAPIKAG